MRKTIQPVLSSFTFWEPYKVLLDYERSTGKSECLKKAKVDSVASGGPSSPEQYFVSFSLTTSSEITAFWECSFSFYSWIIFSSFHKSFWHPSSLVSYPFPLFCLVTWLGTCILRRRKLLSWPSPNPCICYLISLWLFMTQLFKVSLPLLLDSH